MTDFLTLARQRFSLRKYRPDPVPDEDIAAILEAAKLAPTACNNMPQKIYVVRSPEALKKLAEVSPCTFGAPLVMVVGADMTRAAKDYRRPGTFAETDSAIVTAHMMLEAADRGIGSCWVGWFSAADVKTALELPEEVEIYHLMPMGYPAEGAHPAHLHNEFRSMEEIVEYR